jgi:hypothetical protein
VSKALREIRGSGEAILGQIAGSDKKMSQKAFDVTETVSVTSSID